MSGACRRSLFAPSCRQTGRSGGGRCPARRQAARSSALSRYRDAVPARSACRARCSPWPRRARYESPAASARTRPSAKREPGPTSAAAVLPESGPFAPGPGPSRSTAQRAGTWQWQPFRRGRSLHRVALAEPATDTGESPRLAVEAVQPAAHGLLTAPELVGDLRDQPAVPAQIHHPAPLHHNPRRLLAAARRWTTTCSPLSRLGRARNTIVQHPPPSTRNCPANSSYTNRNGNSAVGRR